MAKAGATASASYLYHRSTGFYFHPKKQLYVSPAGFAGQPRTFFRFDSGTGHFALAKKRKRQTGRAAAAADTATGDDDAARRQLLANLQRLKDMSKASAASVPTAAPAAEVEQEDAGAAWLQSRREKRKGQLQQASSRVLAAALME